MSRKRPPAIHGEVSEGYEAVVDVFRRNFTDRGETGAAFSVYADERLVVDIWAGDRDSRQGTPWSYDTMVPAFSVTKGLTAFVVAAAVSRHLLDYDAPVAHYWPEFAVLGKGSVTVRHLLEHRAGLPIFDRPVRLADIADRGKLAGILIEQQPMWEPGTRVGYHPSTGGLYLGELFRRVDPSSRTLGQAFAEDFAQPLGLDFYIGLPDTVSLDRVATLSSVKGARILRCGDFSVSAFVQMSLKRGLAYHAFVESPDIPGLPVAASTEEFLRVESPSVSGVGTARAIARIYGAAAAGSIPPIHPQVLQRITEPVGTVAEWDSVLRRHIRYRLGFRASGFGSEHMFGTAGVGGSFGCADPIQRIGMAYLTNRLGSALLDDTRARRLREAVQHCRSCQEPAV